MKTVVSLSGGLDSTVLAAYLLNTGHDVRAVSFTYGQRHARAELAAATAVAEHLSIPHAILSLEGITSQMDPASSQLLVANPAQSVPEGHYAAATMAATVVPGRNLLMIAAAAAYAASHGADAVALAAHAGDHPVYPDCRPPFLMAAGAALALGYDMNLLFPFADRTKTGIVITGAAIKAPMHLTWSCYNGGPQHCGRCGTCVERYEAFRESGFCDPTTYADTTLAQEVTAR
jgi:7-cyano-7-deazaguanine synthase